MDDATAISDDCTKTDQQAGILGDMIMNELQRSFFKYLAGIQETCAEVCMAQHSCNDEKVRSMLYDVTYEVITDIMELIDGYSSFSSDEHDIVNMVTGERLKENPFLELHDQTEDSLRCE